MSTAVTHLASSDFRAAAVTVSDAGQVHVAETGAFLGDRASMEMFGWEFTEACGACHARPAGHGHFALYCSLCAELPYGHTAPAPARPLLEVLREHVDEVRAQRASRCPAHPAYEADYCPACGTARVIGAR